MSCSLREKLAFANPRSSMFPSSSPSIALSFALAPASSARQLSRPLRKVFAWSSVWAPPNNALQRTCFARR